MRGDSATLSGVAIFSLCVPFKAYPAIPVAPCNLQAVTPSSLNRICYTRQCIICCNISPSDTYGGMAPIILRKEYEPAERNPTLNVSSLQLVYKNMNCVKISKRHADKTET